MSNYNKLMSAKTAWAKMTKERNKYREALLRIQKVSREAENTPTVHPAALEAIYRMADEVLKDGDNCEFAA